MPWRRGQRDRAGVLLPWGGHGGPPSRCFDLRLEGGRNKCWGESRTFF